MIDLIGKIVLIVIVLITSISTVIAVLDAAGLLPQKIAKILIKNKLELTREVLKELGIHTQTTKETISRCLTTESLARLESKLSAITYNINAEIGETSRGYHFKNYIDLMGATTNESNARDFAGLLKTFVEKSSYVDLDSIDYIVTSKVGSPILGYEFAKNVKKPLLLHSPEKKFRTPNQDYNMQKNFDVGGCTQFKNKRALIVEDSTTGGRKVLEAVKDLRNNGLIVKECLVVFAPQGKNAKEKLEKENISLICMTETHSEGK